MEVPTVKLVNQTPVITALPVLPDNVEIGENGKIVVLDQEKKIRREIANSNERRRMQSINSGFQALRTLLPHHEGEKLSKAAILQQTAEYIYSLEQEKTRLLAQNCHLKRLLSLSQQNTDSADSNTEVKRKRVKTEIKEPARVEGLTDLATSKIELIKEPEPIKIAGMAANVTPAVTIVPPQSVVAAALAAEQTQVKIEPKAEPPPLPRTPILTTKAPATLKTGETCQIMISANNTRLPETLVVPIPPLTSASQPDKAAPAAGTRSYIVTGGAAGSSKQNLDSIVEAIKHLEGDHLFSEEVKVPNEVAKEEIVEYLSDVMTVAASTRAPDVASITAVAAEVSAANSAPPKVTAVLPTSPLPQTAVTLPQNATTSKDSFIIFKA